MYTLRFILVFLVIAGCAPTIKIISTGSDEYLVYETDTGDTWWGSGDGVSEQLHKKASTFCGDTKVVEEVKESLADSPVTVPDGSAILRFRCTTASL